MTVAIIAVLMAACEGSGGYVPLPVLPSRGGDAGDGTGGAGSRDGGAGVDGDVGGGSDARNDGGASTRDIGGGTDGGSGTDGGGGGSDGGGADTGEPACDTVCFHWTEPTPVSPPSAGFTEIEVEDCNPSGVDAGRCPDEFVCGRPETAWPSPDLTYSRPWCEGHAERYVIALDVGRPVPVGVPVALDFRMNGGAWPSGSPGSAGEFRLTERETLAAHTLVLPTHSEGRLDTELPAGTYDVIHMAGEGFDSETYSHAPSLGVLDVVAGGVDTVPFEGGILRWSLRADGRLIETLPSSVSSVTSMLWGRTTPIVMETDLAGDRVGGRRMLWPDRYSITLQTYVSDSAAPLSNGRLEWTDIANVTAGGEAVWEAPVTTVEVSGTIRVDGSTVRNGAVAFGSEGALVDSRMPVGGGGGYSGRLYPDTYDVRYESVGTGDLPIGSARFRAGFEPPGRADADLRTVEVSGVVTLNGSEPRGGGRGSVVLAGDGRSRVQLRIDPHGDATVEGRVYEGTYDVYIDGSGDTLPDAFTRAASGWRAVSTPQTWDVRAWPVDITLTHEGRTMPESDAHRGSVVFTRVGADGRPESDPNPLYVSGVALTSGRAYPATGPMTARAFLAPGSWRVAYMGSGFGVVGAGRATFETISVSGPTSRTYDIDSVDVVVRAPRWRGVAPRGAVGRSRTGHAVAPARDPVEVRPVRGRVPRAARGLRPLLPMPRRPRLRRHRARRLPVVGGGLRL